jgi:hypothetical protein
VIVRDTIPITVQEWNEPKKARVGASFVDDRSKKRPLEKVHGKFWLDVKGEGESKSLLLRRWLKHSRTTRIFVRNLCRKIENSSIRRSICEIEKTVAQIFGIRELERAKEMSKKNEENANKKQYHHVLGPGGFNTIVLKC